MANTRKKTSSSDKLRSQNEALLRENIALQQRIKDQEESYSQVELLNVTQANIDFPSPKGEGKRILTPYGTPGCRAVVPEKDWVYWFEHGFLAIKLHEIRVDGYVVPENEDVPKEWKGFAFTPEEIKDFLKMNPQDFKNFADSIEVPEVLYRFWIIADDIKHDMEETEDGSYEDFPYLLPHANYLFSRYSRMKMKLHDIEPRGSQEREVDVISFTQADRISKQVKEGKYKG